MLAAILVPDVSQKIHVFIGLVCGIAEIWMVGYLLVVGVKTASTENTVKPDEHILTTAWARARYGELSRLITTLPLFCPVSTDR